MKKMISTRKSRFFLYKGLFRFTNRPTDNMNYILDANWHIKYSQKISAVYLKQEPRKMFSGRHKDRIIE